MTNQAQYSGLVMEHYRRPRNCGPLPDADGTGQGGGGQCSDTLTIRIRVKGERIVEARFECQGCPPTVACASMITEMAVGKDLDEAAAIAGESVCDVLGIVAAEYRHCGDLAAEALGNAIMDHVVRSIEGRLE
ncbi:MAG: iron-sulfur cluster assembly scaffold protein [Planctomycetota bacterium]|nr:iron-sulfur cluster assembly scaffold protein [Planctomycetota bacterium]